MLKRGHNSEFLNALQQKKCSIIVIVQSKNEMKAKIWHFYGYLESEKLENHCIKFSQQNKYLHLPSLMEERSSQACQDLSVLAGVVPNTNVNTSTDNGQFRARSLASKYE